MTQKTRLTVEENTCRVVSVCQDPEPSCLTYLRERWLEEHSGELFDSGSSDEDEVNPLLLNPTQWKDQDHYAILGLGKLRYRATVQDLKKAYRQKVLAHHPDKQTEEQQKDGDDRFKCIKIAYDILWNPKKRRAYDSVDPTFDDVVPPVCSASREDFYATFGPVIADNARWSTTRQPVPLLGDKNSSVDDVDAFYSFWFNFDSWREYSYQDEENSEKAECREERKWIEKQNKAVRQKKKKEEMARLRLLVDNVYNCDPRVKKFKEAEKAEKEAKKKAKVEAARKEISLRKAEEKRRLEEDRMVREKEEEAAKTQAAQLKKEKEAVKKAFRKERKNIRATCKEHNYFAVDDTELVSRLQDMDKICTSLSLEQLHQLNANLTKDKSFSEAKALFEAQVAELDEREQVKLRETLAATPSSSAGSSTERDSNWSQEETQLLVKAVNVFPAGTVRRWETVAGFINTHSGEGSREKDARMVITKVKNLQKLEMNQKDSLNKQAFSHFEQQHQTRDKGRTLEEQPQATPSERYDNPAPWTAEEQKLLEQALRAHPASVGADRWKRISDAVGTRSKEECVARFKELVAKIKAKKQTTKK